MSTVQRWVWSGLANWLRIGVSILIQFLMIPVLLSAWTLDDLAAWLLVAAIMPYATALDLGHQSFLAYEFMAVADDRESIARIFRSSIIPSIFIGIIQIIGLTLIIFLTPLGQVFVGPDGHLNATGLYLGLQVVAWITCGNFGGIISRAIVPLGYLPRTLWWSLALGIVTGFSPIVVAASGGSFHVAAWITFIIIVTFNLMMIADFLRIMKLERVIWARAYPPNFKAAGKGLLLSGRDMLMQLRQQGIRIVLAPTVGLDGMGSFATMRTLSNVTLQGLTTVLAPIEPDVMRYIRQRDSERLGAVFWLVWAFCALALTPTIIVMQIAMPSIFPIWTHDRVKFDPILFAMLSSSVLFYAIAQPATLVLKGNNLIGVQLMLSALGGTVVIGLLFLLEDSIGIKAAGAGLLVGEIVSYIAVSHLARRWCHAADIRWATSSELPSSLLTAAGAIVTLFLAVTSPTQLPILIAFLIIYAAGVYFIIKQFPESLKKYAQFSTFIKYLRA